jgi:hypothetical protein
VGIWEMSSAWPFWLGGVQREGDRARGSRQRQLRVRDAPNMWGQPVSERGKNRGYRFG